MKTTLILLFVAFLAYLSSTSVYSQCPNVMVPPYTDAVTGGGNAIDFEVERNKTGVNELTFEGNGSLQYKGKNFKPSVRASANVEKFVIYQNFAGFEIAIPLSSSTRSVTTFYSLNTNNCISKKITIPGFILDKVVWNPGSSPIATLCQQGAERFFMVNAKTGVAMPGTKSKLNDPCNGGKHGALTPYRQRKSPRFGTNSDVGIN